MDEIKVFQKAGAVTCDFEGIKTMLNARLNQFRGVLFTEDTKTDAKKTVAEIRKDKKQFLDRIKEVKAEYMRPWDEFNDKAMELADMFDEPINFINAQIEDFENKRKEEKKERISAIYAEMIPESDLQSLLPLSRLYNPRWENATFTEKDIKEEMMTKKAMVKSGLTILEAFDSPAKAKALDIFEQTLDVTEAVKYIQQYEAQAKEIRATEADKARAEAIEAFVPVEGGEENCYTYIITLTDDAKQKLETFMDSVGIDYFIRG